MGRGTAYSEYNFDKLVKKGADWLLLNFHKFETNQKIHIALELIKKKMPVNLKHSGEIDMNVVVDEINRARERLTRITDYVESN